MCRFDDLPVEVLTMILAYARDINVLSTCTLWQDAALALPEYADMRQFARVCAGASDDKLHTLRMRINRKLRFPLGAINAAVGDWDRRRVIVDPETNTISVDDGQQYFLHVKSNHVVVYNQ